MIKTKKLISILLCLMLLVSVLPQSGFAADTQINILTERKTGDSSVVKPIPGKMSEITYKIQQDGVSANSSDFNWSVAPEGQGVSVGNNGNVKISGDTTLESFNLTATLKSDSSVSVTKTLTVIDPIIYDFDTTNSATPQPVASDADGNVYMTANSTAEEKFTDLYLSEAVALTNGQSTVKFKFRIPSGTTSKYFLYDNGWGTRIELANGSSFKLNLKNGKVDTYIAKGLSYGKWYELKIEFDFNSGKYTFYVDNTTDQYMKDIAMPDKTKTATGLKLKYNIDDVMAYSGFDYTPELNIIENSKSLLVPTVNNRTASVKFEATSDDTSAPITWSLAENYSGVTIDPATGVVTVANTANAGDVTVKASQGTLEKTASLNLTKFDEDFEAFSSEATPSSPWNKGKFINENGNTYISDKSNETIRFTLPKVNSGNNLVLEADIAYKDGTITLYDITNSWTKLAQPTNFSVFNRTGWNKLKLIFDYKNSAYSLFVNNEVIVYHKTIDGTNATSVLGFERANLDNVTVYNVSNTAPEALNAKLSDVLAGDNATISYKYFDESGMAENCTDIKWYISNSKDSGYTLINGANEKTLLTTNEMAGKYLKAVVTPAHNDEFDPSSTKTGEAVEAICRVFDMSAEVTSVTAGGKDVDFGKTNVSADETNVAATFNLKTAPNTEKTFVLALAYYTDGALTKLDYQEVTLDENTQTSSKTLNIISGAGTYKLFAWDKKANTPLMQSLSFK
ncbi:MAG: hypothetical protein IKJ68_05065 [Clostridia bacterium]|nr:hypothetical protein [Clostridia bacterium]